MVEPAMSAVFGWNNAAGGLFNAPAIGPPSVRRRPARRPPADEAVFNLNNAYTVAFQSSVTNAKANVQTGTVTLALAGYRTS